MSSFLVGILGFENVSRGVLWPPIILDTVNYPLLHNQWYIKNKFEMKICSYYFYRILYTKHAYNFNNCKFLTFRNPNVPTKKSSQHWWDKHAADGRNKYIAGR